MRMSLDEFDAWLELHEWSRAPDADGPRAMGASAAERAFFHL